MKPLSTLHYLMNNAVSEIYIEFSLDLSRAINISNTEDVALLRLDPPRKLVAENRAKDRCQDTADMLTLSAGVEFGICK